MSSIVRNTGGSGIFSCCGTPGWELCVRTRPGANSVIVTGSLLQIRLRSRLCSQSRPTRTRCVVACQMMESVR